MSAQSNAPVIIKRKKIVAGGGHHGGAWKVAYADFVTAMMAFFMLMWLLNATTEKQRKGIADYFNPTIPVNRISGGGEGSFGGTNIFSEQVLAQNGTGASLNKPTEENQARGAMGVDASSDPETAAGETDAAMMERIDAVLTGKAGESMVSRDMQRHIVTRVTDEGLIVELFDVPGVPLFTDPGDAPEPMLGAVVTVIAALFASTANQIAVEGHLQSVPIVRAAPDRWTRSTQRADTVRQLLEAEGTRPARIARVTGHADRAPVAANAMAARNNRIEIILLRRNRS
ncbi:flagellar motor protein MotB [Anianabacter salinae]|uniref:flagellar motor protein MotB n=1 Tax=Anianabacter salinae TaxID=2851023 RepID=UPI00225E6262|nr:flagellar motor protein MotB [Anianabacter salinae]MBV0913442.1 OmpA family protein [Anianabacter salinae]